jgi:HEAT repeat protein
VVGGLVTRPLAGAIGVGNLLFVWVGCLIGSAALIGSMLDVRRRTRTARVRVRRRRPTAWHDVVDGLSFVRRSPLLVWMTAAGVLFSILFYSLFLPFAQAATARYPDPKALAGFFGFFGATVTAVAFVISVGFANRLLGWLGAALVILVLPVLYAGSFGVLLASSAFATLVAVRAGVTVWLQGVTSPAWETLVNVVPDAHRDQVRAFFSGGPSQTGTAIAGIITLVGQQALSAKQLSVIGLVVALITIAVAVRIRGSYTRALVDALRAGRPSVFGGRPVEGTAVVLERDATAVALAVDAARDPDPRVRRLGVEMLTAEGGDARVLPELEQRAGDEDPVVRALATRGLGRAGALAGETLERALEDDDAAVRLSAIESLAGEPVDGGVAERLSRLVSDPDPSVATAACAVLLRGPARTQAAERLGRLLADETVEVRIAAVGGLRSATDEDVVGFVRPLLGDRSPVVRAAALRTLGASAPDAAIVPAIEAFGQDDDTIRAAALEVLTTVDLHEHANALRDLARKRESFARHDLELAAAIPVLGEETELLRTALVGRGRSHAVAALSVLSVLSRDGDAILAAIDNLGGDPDQLANAIETLEATEHRSVVSPLVPLWESAEASAVPREDWIDFVANDPDPLIRSCVELLRTTEQRGDDMAHSRTSMSPIERVLVLRRIPLFAELSAVDLRRLADVADERTFVTGEVISAEGEIGDELHLVLAGTVIVARGGVTTGSVVARRGPGEVVGEMSIITRNPRVASLLAEDDVRTLRIGRREFESVIRERPDVSLALLRVLAERLGEETRERAGTADA